MQTATPRYKWERKGLTGLHPWKPKREEKRESEPAESEGLVKVKTYKGTDDSTS